MCKQFLLFFLLCCTCSSVIGQSLRLITYNMRYDAASDGENAWSHRKDMFVRQLLEQGPDIVGTQEGLPHQIQYIDERLIEYSYVGIGRDGIEKGGEYSALFYNESKLELLKSGTFWLSKTPVKSSTGWDAALPRICTYGLFKEKMSGTILFVFNTHLDHVGVKARKKSLRVIEKMIAHLNPKEYPVVVMGDLNADPDDKIIRSFSKAYTDTGFSAHEKQLPAGGTFNAFDLNAPARHRIDYIFLDKENFVIDSYQILVEPAGHSFLSDHFPVIVDVTLKR